MQQAHQRYGPALPDIAARSVIVLPGSIIQRLAQPAGGFRRVPSRGRTLVGLENHLGIVGRIGFQPRFELLRSEEHTSELQSLMRNSYAVFCLKKTKTTSN